MWFTYALAAAIGTSFLPIINKQLLKDVPSAVVAWVINALSLPLLLVGTLLIAPLPEIDWVFIVAVLASGAVNWVATLISTEALRTGDASLVTPLLTFNPPFTLLVALVTLGESPTLLGVLGVLTVILGAYLFEAASVKRGAFEPIRALLRRPGALLAIGASFLWALTPIFEKVAIQHTQPENSSSVALATTALMVAGLTWSALRVSGIPWTRINERKVGFGAAAAIAGVAPLFGFAAIAGGLVGYVTALFKMSTILTVLWARLILKEEGFGARLPGAITMASGALLIAL